jgi:hypothetical protein
MQPYSLKALSMVTAGEMNQIKTVSTLNNKAGFSEEVLRTDQC